MNTERRQNNRIKITAPIVAEIQSTGIKGQINDLSLDGASFSYMISHIEDSFLNLKDIKLSLSSKKILIEGLKCK